MGEFDLLADAHRGLAAHYLGCKPEELLVDQRPNGVVLVGQGFSEHGPTLTQLVYESRGALGTRQEILPLRDGILFQAVTVLTSNVAPRSHPEITAEVMRNIGNTTVQYNAPDDTLYLERFPGTVFATKQPEEITGFAFGDNHGFDVDGIAVLYVAKAMQQGGYLREGRLWKPLPHP